MPKNAKPRPLKTNNEEVVVVDSKSAATDKPKASPNVIRPKSAKRS